VRKDERKSGWGSQKLALLVSETSFLPRIKTQIWPERGPPPGKDGAGEKGLWREEPETTVRKETSTSPSARRGIRDPVRFIEKLSIV